MYTMKDDIFLYYNIMKNNISLYTYTITKDNIFLHSYTIT